MEILAIIYLVIALISYVNFIQWLKARGHYIDWEDIFCGFLGFGVLWIFVRPVFHFNNSGLGDKILDWVNKKS